MELNGTFFATVVAFLILYGLLYKLLYAPVSKMMNDRTERIRSAIEEAENARGEAERLLGEYKQQISSVRSEAQEILDQAKALAEQTKEDLLGKAKADATRVMDKANHEIERQKIQAIEELQSRVADLAVGAASAVIVEELDSKSHARVIEEYLERAAIASDN